MCVQIYQGWGNENENESAMPGNNFCHVQGRDEKHYWEALLRDAGDS